MPVRIDRTMCDCGARASERHGAGCQTPEARVRPALLAAVFGGSPSRRAMLRGLGAASALAVLDTLLPIDTLEAMAAEPKPLETKELTVGFIAITCAAPLLLADKLGLFSEAGLDVELIRTPGWDAMRDRLRSGEYHASHILSPMPLTMTLGEGSPPTPTRLAVMQNINGQAITLAGKHKERRDPAGWKGFTLGLPYNYSMHALLLRTYLARAGIDPDRDVQLRYVQPPEMLPQLKAGVIDGFLGPEPFNQMAVHEGVGFIHLLTKDIWPGHPCCGFGMLDKFAAEAPNTYLTLARAVAKASLHCREPGNRQSVAGAISGPKYLPQPVEVIEQVLTGTFPDGLGETHQVADRIDFDPYPDPAFAVWMLAQLKRWKLVTHEFEFGALAAQVFRAADTHGILTDIGAAPSTARGITVLGAAFDPANPRF